MLLALVILQAGAPLAAQASAPTRYTVTAPPRPLVTKYSDVSGVANTASTSCEPSPYRTRSVLAGSVTPDVSAGPRGGSGSGTA